MFVYDSAINEYCILQHKLWYFHKNENNLIINENHTILFPSHSKISKMYNVNIQVLFFRNSRSATRLVLLKIRSNLRILNFNWLIILIILTQIPTYIF